MPIIDTHPDTSLIEIIKDLRDDTLTLFRQEVALVKREMAAKAVSYGKNAAFIAVGAVVAVYAVFFLFLFLNNLLRTGLTATGLSDPVSSWIAPLMMGMLLGIGALLLALKAIRAMKKETPLPEKTLESLREDKDWIQAKVRR